MMTKQKSDNTCCIPVGQTYLQFPDAFTVSGYLLHGLAHESDKHVEEEDVREHDVGDEKDEEHLLVLVLLCELQVTHADGELKELQSGEVDVVERVPLAARACMCTSTCHHLCSSCAVLQGLYVMGRLLDESHNSYRIGGAFKEWF